MRTFILLLIFINPVISPILNLAMNSAFAQELANDHVFQVGEKFIVSGELKGRAKGADTLLLGKTIEIVKLPDPNKQGWNPFTVRDEAGTEYQISNTYFRPHVLATSAEEQGVKATENLNETLKKTAAPAQTDCAKVIAGITVAEGPKTTDQACMATASHPKCTGTSCSTELKSISNARLQKYIKWIIEETNTLNTAYPDRFWVDPALVLAMIAAESGGEPTASSNDGGKGLLQFTVQDKKDSKDVKVQARRKRTVEWIQSRYKLKYDEEAPTEAAIKAWADKQTPAVTQNSSESYYLSNEFNTPDAQGNYSIWSPRGSIRAALLKISSEQSASMRIKVGENKVDVSSLFLNADAKKSRNTHMDRYATAIYNAGAGTIQKAMQTYYDKNTKIPQTIGQLYEEKLAASTGSAKNTCINRCHVEKIAGLCSDTPSGYVQTYQQYFEQNESGVWASKNI